MVKLTLYNDADIVVNADLIESVERTPDTLISLTTGKKVMVKESVEDVIGKVIAYRRLILSDCGLQISDCRLDPKSEISNPKSQIAEGSETWT